MGQWLTKVTVIMLLSMMMSAYSIALELKLNGQDSLSISQPLPTRLTSTTPSRSNLNTQPSYWLNQSYSSELYNKAIQPGPNTSWHKIALTGDFNGPDQEYVLVVNMHILQNLNLYLFDGEQLIHSKQLGLNSTQLPDRPYHSPHFRFNIQAGQQLHLLISMQSDGPGLMPITLYSPDSYKDEIRLQDIFWAAIIAVLLAMVLYNVFVYAMNPNGAYLWYLAFHSTAFVYFSALFGFGFWLWPLEIQLVLAKSIMHMNFLLLFIIINFANVFLETKKYATNHHKYLHFFSVSGLVGFFSCFWLTEYETIAVFSILQFSGSIFGISMGYTALKNKFYPARFFLLSWSFTIVGGAIGLMTFMNVLPTNFFNMHGFLFGTMGELFLLSIALASRIKYTEAKLLSQSYMQPDSKVANLGYLKQILPEFLPKIFNQHQQLVILVANPKGFREMLSLYGPAIITNTYTYFTNHISQFLSLQKWGVALPLPTGEQVYIVALPSSQILILLSVDGTDDNKNLENAIESLIQESDRIVKLSDVKMGLELEVGYAFLNSPKDFNTVYLQAQTALLSSEKKINTYHSYNPVQDTLINEKLDLMHDLESAIINENIDIYVQPQFNLIDNTLHGGEVLLRWFHPEKGNILPSQFISLAEKSGLIFPITHLVIKKSCQWLKQLKDNGANLEDFKLSINLSALDLTQDSLLPYLQQTLLDYQVAVTRLTLEVTESAAMDNPEKFLSTIKQLKEAGFTISIDDFGTGYSSMQYLQTMQAEEIKIDIAFIRDIHINETNQNIVKAIIQLAHSTHAHTVAEGVEFIEEAEYLKSLNCQVAQGFHWDPALPLDAFERKYLHN